MTVAFGTSSTASHSSTFVSSLAINKPTSTADGDFLILAVETTPTSQGGPTVTAPAGWTAFSFSPLVGGSGSELWVWYKVASGEGASYSLSFSPTIDDVVAFIARYTGVDPASPIANTGTTGDTGVTSKAVATPTGIGTGGVSVMIGGARPDSGTATLTITMPGTSRIASFYASAGASDFGAAIAMSDSTSTASGNMTISASSEISQATIVLNEVVDLGPGTYTMPSWVSAGTVSASASTATPALPTGWAQDDVFLLFVESMNGAAGAPTGWAQVGSTQFANTGSTTTETALDVYWKRATASESAPTLADSGNHQVAIIHAFRGCTTSGNPWNVQAGATETTSDTSGSCPTVTTSVDNTLVVCAATAATDIGTARFSSWTNANLSSLTERSDDASTLGNGGGVGVATGGKATAGSTGATAVTYATASAKGLMTIALQGVFTPTTGSYNSVGILVAF